MPEETIDQSPVSSSDATHADATLGEQSAPDHDTPSTHDRPSGDRSVPLAALLAERRHYKSQMDELRRELEGLKKTTTQSASQRPATEEDAIRQQWREFLRLNQLEEKLSSYDKGYQELTSHLQAINQAIQQMAPVIEGGQLAMSMYFDKVRDYALQSYNPSIPVSKDAYERLVAAEMTDSEVAAIRSGDLRALDKVIDRVKKAFTQSGGAQRAVQEAARLRSLPRPPAPGGVPAEKEPEEPKTLKDLHNAAWDTFQQALKRHGE